MGFWGSVYTFWRSVSSAYTAAGMPLVLMSGDAAAIDAALSGGAAAEKPLVHAATTANWQAMAEVAKKHGCPLAIRAAAGDVVGLAELSENVRGAGVDDLLLDPGTTGLGGDLVAFTQLRRLALKKGARALGFPIVADSAAATWQAELARATQAVAKYAGVVIIDHLEPAAVYALLTLRQNVYTDPQKPIQVEPKLYEVGSAGPDSPLLVTTNFSLTYFSVSGEVEGAGVPAWLLVADSDGQSVLTGWAAGKFDAEKIAKTVKDSGIESRISHKKLVIPGHVAGLSGELEEELPGWQIMVGPRDAVDIPNYLKNVWSA
jgi:acetyl-CoA decarbonylase/synthase complex subunit gamma